MYPPWALVRGHLDRQTYRRRYRHQLHRLTPKLLREVVELQAGYDAPLVLLCYCVLTQPDGWCHRTMLAEWLGGHLDVEISELDGAR